MAGGFLHLRFATADQPAEFIQTAYQSNMNTVQTAGRVKLTTERFVTTKCGAWHN